MTGVHSKMIKVLFSAATSRTLFERKEEKQQNSAIEHDMPSCFSDYFSQ